MESAVYRFIDKSGEVVYVGHTQNMVGRMALHFGKQTEYRGQIPEEERDKIKRVEYVETASSSDMLVLEVYLIALWKPKYNKDFVVGDELTIRMDISGLEWKEWELGRDDNPHHHIFVWKDDVLLYEIPKVGCVYTCLCMKLGLTTDMNFGYSKPIYDNGYKLMRLSEKRRIKTGSMAQRPRYSFMGYPEAFSEAV